MAKQFEYSWHNNISTCASCPFMVTQPENFPLSDINSPFSFIAVMDASDFFIYIL